MSNFMVRAGFEPRVRYRSMWPFAVLIDGVRTSPQKLPSPEPRTAQADPAETVSGFRPIVIGKVRTGIFAFFARGFLAICKTGPSAAALRLRPPLELPRAFDCS
jgi:hypothetical protein